MRKYEGLMTIVVVVIVLALMLALVQAQEGPVSYGGIEFPLGNKSFADEVVGFNPGSGTGESDGSAVIGPPDGAKDTGPSIIGSKGDVTLGKGGSIILKFTDNYLIDAEGLDLYVFEYGQEAEPFKVEISKDGSVWIDLGTVRGQPTGVDIHGKVAPGDRFSYVRITDANPYAPRDPKTIGQSIYVGADIDAVGAIGAEEKPASDGDGAPGVTGPPPPTPGACNWSGTWNTSRGKMELVQTGNAQAGANVTGTASLMVATAQNQTGTIAFQDVSITAIVLGDKLAGTWSQPPSYGPPKDAGDIEFTISPDCKSFTGNWRYGYGSGASPAWDGAWTGTRSGASTPPATPSETPATKQTACASAKPSITEGSVFKRATFTIGGTQPQTIRITKSAENFSIKEEYGKVVFQVIKGKNWGSLTLEPGNYILSCNGGGAMGLMSASACVEYPVVGGTVPPGTPPVSPPSGPNDPNKPGQKDAPPPEMIKPAVPLGPIERIIVRSDLSNKSLDRILQIEIGKKAQFNACGVDAAHPDQMRPVIVDEWKISKESSGIGSIDKNTGEFTAGPNPGLARIMARVGDLWGVLDVNVTAWPPVTFIGCVQLFDEHNALLQIPAGGVTVEVNGYWFKDRKAYDKALAAGGTGISLSSGITLVHWGDIQTDSRGRYWFTVQGSGYSVISCSINELFVPAPVDYEWNVKLGGGPNNMPSNNSFWQGTLVAGSTILLAPEDFPCFQLWLEKVIVTYTLVGKVTHHGKPVEGAKVKLFYQGKAVKEDRSDYEGEYWMDVGNLPGGNYRLTAKYQPPPPPKKDQPPPPEKIATVHTWLYIRKDIWIELPSKTEKETVNIELISFAEKIGYTGP